MTAADAVTSLSIERDVLSAGSRWRAASLAAALLRERGSLGRRQLTELLRETIESALADLGERRLVDIEVPITERGRRALAERLCRLAAAGSMGGRETVRLLIVEICGW